MNNHRRYHDHAWAISEHCLSIFEPLLREEEKGDARRELYEAIKQGLVIYDLMRERELARLRPSKN